MRLYIDTADPDRIATAAERGLVDGVTTNPSLVAARDRSYRETVSLIREHVDGPIYAQVLAESVGKIVEQARHYATWDDNLVVKIPATSAGLAALAEIRTSGIDAGITVVFTVGQALLAAKNDATFVAPYVGRIDDSDGDGVGVAGAIQAAFDRYGFDTELLAASVRTQGQADRLIERGVDAMTLAPDVLDEYLADERTLAGLRGFRDDWKRSRAPGIDPDGGS